MFQAEARDSVKHKELRSIREMLTTFFARREPRDPNALVDSESRKFVNDCITKYKTALQDLHKEHPAIDEHRIGRAKTIAQRPIFICGSMKSGTSLLQNLLDGHDDCFVVPGDGFLLKSLLSPLDDDAVLSIWIYRLIAPTGINPPSWYYGCNDQAYVDFVNYYEYWMNKLRDRTEQQLLAIVSALYCSNPRGPRNPKYWVEKTPGNEWQAEMALKHFPAAKYIHIIRNPHANVAALKRKARNKTWEWSTPGAATAVRNSIHLALRYQEQLGPRRYHVVHYEDLVKDTKSEMTKLADFLGIEMTGSLLVPTVNTTPARSNSQYNERRVTGTVTDKHMDMWRTELSGAEERFISATFYLLQKKTRFSWDIGFLDFVSGWPDFLEVKGKALVKRMR